MLSKRFLDRVSEYITANRLLRGDAKHIVALSGGADSVLLTLALKQLGYTVEAAHCNFHLRGKESDRDEDFCKSFCEKNGVPLHIVHFDTTGYASLHKVSIEMAARKLRYSYFEQLRRDIGAETICVAHHKDDTVETVLMNLIRGTGIHGLTGISCKNGNIVRPLLCVFRNEIEEELGRVGQSYVVDSTNLEDDVVRNKIRLNLVPMMREFNPSVSGSIAATAKRMTDAAKVFDAAIESAIGRILEHSDDGSAIVSIDALKSETAPEYVLYTLLKEYSFTPSQAEIVYGALLSEPGRMFVSSTHQLLIDRGKLIIEPKDQVVLRSLKIPEPGLYVYTDDMKLRFTVVASDGFKVDRSPRCACLDASCVVFPLMVRPVGKGDRFTPFGMRGTKLVSDYLTDRKKTLFEKRHQLVVADSSGRIIWLVGERPDNLCRITEATRQVLRIAIID